MCILTSFTMTYLDFVWVNKLCVGINIVDILVSQSHPVAPVQRANVVVYRRLHGLPVVCDCTDGSPVSQVPFHLDDIPGQTFDPSPVSSNSQPNLRASWIAVRSRAVWCISFFGMQPTLTQVPPRPDNHKERIVNQQEEIQQLYCKWRDLTPGGSFRRGHHIVQDHDLLSQSSCFLLLKKGECGN